MVRTQIQLTAEQAEAVKAVSKSQGVSSAEVIRRAIDLLLTAGGHLSDAEKRARARKVVGRFRSGYTDTAKNHDAHLADAYSR